MPANEEHSTASPAVKKDTMPKTAPDVKKKGKQGLKLISLTLMQKKTHYMKEAKPKEAG
jgi:hypothetical protein